MKIAGIPRNLVARQGPDSVPVRPRSIDLTNEGEV